jgi:hypothetical protein
VKAAFVAAAAQHHCHLSNTTSTIATSIIIVKTSITDSFGVIVSHWDMPVVRGYYQPSGI